MRRRSTRVTNVRTVIAEKSEGSAAQQENEHGRDDEGQHDRTEAAETVAEEEEHVRSLPVIGYN